MGAQLTVDNVGRTYIGIATAWTLVLYSAMGVLWYHRQLPQLQMRRLPLVFAAITILHIYWTLCMIGYVIAPVIPCAAEYWVMSILLPFGIAIFQVANTQFLYVACGQRRFNEARSLSHMIWKKRLPVLDGQTGLLQKRFSRWLRKVDPITKMMIVVGIGMVIQAVLAIVIFLLARKFHSSFGVIPANLSGSNIDQRMQCSRGWEWWPSIVWQVFWSWIYGPHVLWRSRNIRDTHDWRIQTILCCIAGLPCTPLWLCGLYLPQFAAVNAVFSPPSWFAIAIFFIQLFTVFIPCYQVYRRYRLRTNTLDAIEQCETQTGSLSSEAIDDEATQVDWSSNCSYAARRDSEKRASFVLTDRASIDSTKKSHLFTIVALDWALVWNPNPLQEFAALKDFSGENIAFLTHLTNWKRLWPRRDSVTQQTSPSTQQKGDCQGPISEDLLREAYNCAIALYCVLVSPDYAEFPINLCCQTSRRLDAMFARSANLFLGDTSSQDTIDAAAPFATTTSRSKSVAMSEVEDVKERGASTGILRFPGMYYQGDIPVDFTSDCFDAAEEEIKYLVLTNTWPRFVQAGHAEEIRDPQGRSLAKRLAQHFVREPCR